VSSFRERVNQELLILAEFCIHMPLADITISALCQESAYLNGILCKPLRTLLELLVHERSIREGDSGTGE
jgi:hypothetical protein